MASGAGASKHRHLQGGLNGNEAGWDTSWVTDSLMHVKASDFDTFLACGTKATWGGTQGDKPINCVTWWEAEAFCIWDGGFLPSAAEWNYAAAGGSWLNKSVRATSPSTTTATAAAGRAAAPTPWAQARARRTEVGRWGRVRSPRQRRRGFRPTVRRAPPSRRRPVRGLRSQRLRDPRYAHGSWWDYAGGLTTRVDKYVTNRSGQVGFRCARLP
ncbi:MAG: SUMF1/EgtB/PvdO family nonheme iron enzyme [Polyangiaceae bacterium]